MCQLVESIKLKDGIIQNLEYHQNRLNRSLDELYPASEKIDLSSEILIPDHCKVGIYKVRVLYGQTVNRIEIEPYVFRSIRCLKVVHHESIDYHLKYTDRQIFQELFDRRGDCDDIIIIKGGWVTDSYTANLLFFDGEKWFTPASPLMKGTKRQLLVDRGIVSETAIREEDLRNYLKAGLINAMIDFEEMPVVQMDKICY